MTASLGSAVRRPATTQSGPSFGRVVAAEWTKLLGLRSAITVIGITAVVTGGLTYAFSSAASGDPGFVPTENLTDGMVFAFIGFLVVGVLVATGEFSTGTFRSTFAAVPRRWPVLVAHVVVTAAFASEAAVVIVGAAVLGVLPASASRNMSLDLFVDGVPQVLVGAVGYLVGTMLLGLAIGALLRRPVPALVIAFLVVLILPLGLSLAVEFATDPLAVSRAGTTPPAMAAVNTVETFTPVGAGGVLMDADGSGLDGAPHLGVLGATLVLAAWVVVPLAGAAYRLRRRDLV